MGAQSQPQCHCQWAIKKLKWGWGARRGRGEYAKYFYFFYFYSKENESENATCKWEWNMYWIGLINDMKVQAWNEIRIELNLIDFLLFSSWLKTTLRISKHSDKAYIAKWINWWNTTLLNKKNSTNILSLRLRNCDVRRK